MKTTLLLQVKRIKFSLIYSLYLPPYILISCYSNCSLLFRCYILLKHILYIHRLRCKNRQYNCHNRLCLYCCNICIRSALQTEFDLRKMNPNCCLNCRPMAYSKSFSSLQHTEIRFRQGCMYIRKKQQNFLLHNTLPLRMHQGKYHRY